jgi:L-proline amide hydrolase
MATASGPAGLARPALPIGYRYDQLGCGRSDHPDDPALLQVQRFVAELAEVREALGLDRLHLYGQSWGGMLALEVALSGAPGIASLVLSNAPASMPLWVAETMRLRRVLPADVQAVLDAHEQAGSTDSPAYQEAMMLFYGRHVCRLDPWPDCLVRSLSAMEEDPRVACIRRCAARVNFISPAACAIGM